MEHNEENRNNYVGIIKVNHEKESITGIDMGYPTIEELESERSDIKADYTKNIILYLLSCIGLGALIYKMLDFFGNMMVDSYKIKEIDRIIDTNREFEENPDSFIVDYEFGDQE